MPCSSSANAATRNALLTACLACQDAELDRLHELFANVGTSTAQPEPDCSAAQWLRQQGASERMLSGVLPAFQHCCTVFPLQKYILRYTVMRSYYVIRLIT